MGKGRNIQRKKRKHHFGNQFFNKKPKTDEQNQKKEIDCASSTKIDDLPFIEKNVDKMSYNLIIDISILQNMISAIACCEDCNSRGITIENIGSSRMGFSNKLKLSCSSCAWEKLFFTSKDCKSQLQETIKQGRNSFETNIRMVAAFREIGRGFGPLENFCRVANIKGLSHTSFDEINNKLMVSYSIVANESMKRASECVHKLSKKNLDGSGLCRVSLDGSWQRRGHASLHGVVTTISNGKCIDTEILSKFCRGCTMWNSKKGTPAYDIWKTEHMCEINHTKSSGAMEGAGATSMFCRSVEKNNLIYEEYLGDGDTSSFKEVVDSNPYEEQGIIPKKLECVGHVQKRLGTRLRKVVKNYKRVDKLKKNGKDVEKVIKLSGKGKLTDTAINSMQNYYGLAIRSNKGNIYTMKKAVGAVLYHCTDFGKPELRHRFCPDGPNSWCKWKLDQLHGTKRYRPNISIPKWIHDVLYPTFIELRSDELLKKCLHGETQNANEAINQFIWNKIPKNVFVSRRVLQMGVNSAIIEFNDGNAEIEKVLNLLGINFGRETNNGTMKRNSKRIDHSRRKSSELGKQRRKKLRTIKKGFADKEKELEEVECYVPGGF